MQRRVGIAVSFVLYQPLQCLAHLHREGKQRHMRSISSSSSIDLSIASHTRDKGEAKASGIIAASIYLG